MKRSLVPSPADPTVMLVPLAKGKGFAKISRKHASVIGQHNWFLHRRKADKTSYAQTHVRTLEGRWVAMELHRMIGVQLLGFDPAYDVDHKDHDGLNCVDGNLRPATIAQNQQNTRIRSNNKSGVSGVHLDKAGKWRVQVQAKGRRRRFGPFTDLAEAEVVAVAARNRLHGNFACDKEKTA